MSTIGNYDDARLILEHVRESEHEDYFKPMVVEDRIAPEGWEFVATGSFRSVWMSPEGVAYKVQHSRSTWQGNGEEYDNLQQARSCELPADVRLPEADLYEIDTEEGHECVIAMELVRGTLLDNYEGADRRLRFNTLYECENILGLSDFHGENALVDNSGFLVIVDLGG